VNKPKCTTIAGCEDESRCEIFRIEPHMKNGGCFMKAILYTIALIVIFGLRALAQSSPSLTMTHHGDATAHDAFSWGPPPSGPNILFYGGDVNPNDPNAYAVANGNTLYVPTAATYGAVRVPATGHFVITGVFFNQIATQSGDIFDPPTATYDIRIGLSEGNGGTSVASGSGPQRVQPTGRMLFGDVEYTTSVALDSPLVAPDGETIWVNESPQCTDGSNLICRDLQYYATNTTQKTGSVNGGAQPTGQIFFYDPLDFPWVNWCSLGLNAQQCADLSFGIYGHR
jgi:hypothetical protein